MDDVMGVFRAEAGEHHATFVGDSVVVGVLEVDHFSAVGDVCAAITDFNPRGDEQAASENGGFFGLAIAVLVF